MKTQLLYLSTVALTSLSLLGTVNADSAKVVNPINGHTYQRFDTYPKTWTNARSACSVLGSYLVTISSAYENNLVTNLTNSTIVGSWLGGSDEAQEGSWKWVNDEVWSYSAWRSGEPNNSGNEDYLYSLNGTWNDLNNTYVLPYVCEWDPIQYSNATAIPDITGDGKSDVALIAKLANTYYLRTVSGTTGTLIRPITLGASTQLTPISLTIVDDANANNTKEIAVLYSKPDGSNTLQLYDSSTGVAVKTIPLPK